MVVVDELREELKIAINASIAAGVEIIRIYNSDFDIEFKEDRSPLTEADRAANKVIMSFLNTTNIPIISEENKQIDYDIRKNWSGCWIVDPLDGTKEFIKRNGEFTVNIALIDGGELDIGVIYVPVTRTLYAADVKQKKAFKAVLTESKHTLDQILEDAVTIGNNDSSQSELIRVVGSRSHMNRETENFVNAIKGKEVEIISRGSSLKFCLIAEGKADIYPRFAPTMEWDTAAGHAICKAVGANLINWETKEELQYNKEDLLNPWFICK